jgi:hypothetical protein
MNQEILALIAGVKAAAAGHMVTVPRDVLLEALNLIPGVDVETANLEHPPNEDIPR